MPIVGLPSLLLELTSELRYWLGWDDKIEASFQTTADKMVWLLVCGRFRNVIREMNVSARVARGG